MASELLAKIARGVDVELPESLVEDETRAVLKRILSAYPQARLGEEQARGWPPRAGSRRNGTSGTTSS